MFYVYLLESLSMLGQRYVGFTTDLNSVSMTITPESHPIRPNSNLRVW